MSRASVWAAPREGVGYASELLTVVALSFALSFAVGGVFLLWRGRALRTSWRSAFPTAVVLAVLLSLFGIANTDLHLEAPVPGVERSGSGGRLGIRLKMDWRGPAMRNGGEERGDEGLLPADLGRTRFVRLLLLVVGVLGLALAVRARRPATRPGAHALRGLDPADPRARAAAHGAVVTTIDAMLADPDPRTAIIGAYARLLEELEAIGASRMDYEGPREHLHRVLSVLEVSPRPLRTLIELFEVARFSTHSLTTSHRHEALDALQDVATSLATPAGVS